MIRLTDSSRALLAGVSIFVIGLVGGCALDRTILAPPASAAATATQYGPRHHEEVLAELGSKLGLSTEQAARVREIFAQRQPEIEAAWTQVHANLQHAMQQTTSEIETVLDSAQVERLHAWLAERHGPSRGHAPARHH